MDERKSVIRELEQKKRADTDARNRLLEGLGETLIQRIGEEGSFPETPEAIVGILAEYRGLKKEIADSAEAIKSLEADNIRLKELDDDIASREAESSRLTKDFIEACTRLGKALLALRDYASFADSYRVQEESLLAKIEEQEQKAKELEEREGGVLAWLGKNAQLAVSKALILKSKSSLQKVYRGAGEQFFAARLAEPQDAEALEAAQGAEEIKNRLSTLAADISILKGERRKLTDVFGAEGTPSRRISTLQKRMAFIRDEFPGLYLKLGALAAKPESKEALASYLTGEDNAILERAGFHQSIIEEGELKIKKVKASISIDNEKAEIEKIKKAIASQRQKIAAANEEIAGLEKQIQEAEFNIDEYSTVLREE